MLGLHPVAEPHLWTCTQILKSKSKWIDLVGLVLSAFSILVQFLLARFTEDGIADYQSSITIFSWRPIFENPDLSSQAIINCAAVGSRYDLNLFFVDFVDEVSCFFSPYRQEIAILKSNKGDEMYDSMSMGATLCGGLSTMKRESTNLRRIWMRWDSYETSVPSHSASTYITEPPPVSRPAKKMQDIIPTRLLSNLT